MPLLWVFLALIVGIAFASSFGFDSRVSLTLFLGLGVLALVSSSFVKSPNFRFIPSLLLLSAVASFGVFRYSIVSAVSSEDIVRLVGRQVRLFGSVGEEIQVEGERQRFDLEVDSVSIEGGVYTARGIARIYLYRARTVDFGDILALDCILEQPRPATNPHGFDFRKSLELKGIKTIAFVRGDDNIAIIGKNTAGLYRRLTCAIRDHVEKTIKLIPEYDETALLRGLLLGKGGELPTPVRRAFEDSGTVHILAVSGLHVGIIAGILWLLFGKIVKMPKPLAVCLCILGLALYAGVVGGRPSVLRAALMFSIILFGSALKRPSNPMNSIGAAGATLLVIEPLWLFDIGFQLSFAATLGIIYLLPYFEEWLPARHVKSGFLRKFVLGALAVSIAANIGTAPFVAFVFHRLQTISPLANIFVVPFVGSIIGYGILASVLSLFWENGAIWVLQFDRLILRVILEAASFFATTRFSYLPFPRPAIAAFGLYYLFIIALPPILSRRTKGILAIGIFLTAAAASTWAMFEMSRQRLDCDLRVTFFDIGQGDCALIEFKDGRKAIIDGGPPDNAAFAVLPYLESNSIAKIDLAILSHPDADHLGGIVDIFDEVPYDALAVPHRIRTNDLYGRFLDRLDSLEVPITIYTAGDTIPGFPELIAIWPDSTAVSPAGSLLVNVNEASLVILLELGEVEFLFCGDIGFPSEAYIEGIEEEIDILKVPHHGGKFSCSQGLIETATPLASIVSVGAKNRFGHPSPQVLDRLNKSGSETFRTDISGAITIEVLGDSIFIETFDGNTLRFSGLDQPLPRRDSPQI